MVDDLELEAEAKWKWAQAQKAQRKGSFFSTDTLKGVGQAAVQGMAGVGDSALSAAQAFNSVVNPALAENINENLSFARQQGVPTTLKGMADKYVGEPQVTATGASGNAQEALYDATRLGVENLATPGSMIEKGATTALQTAGGLISEGLGGDKSTGQAVGGFLTPLGEMAYGDLKPVNPEANALQYEAAANGVTPQGLAQSLKRGASFENGAVDTPILNSYKNVAADGGFQRGAFQARETPAQILSRWEQRQGQLENQANGLAAQADEVLMRYNAPVIPDYPNARNFISSLDDVAERKAAAEYLATQAEDYNKLGTVQNVLARKRQIYGEINSVFDRAANAQDPAWKTGLRRSLAQDLKETSEKAIDMAGIENGGNQLRQLNDLWGSYSDMFGEIQKPIAKGFGQLPLEGTNVTTKIGNVPIVNSLSGSTKRGLAWINKQLVGVPLPDPNVTAQGPIAAMREFFRGAVPDPNFTPPASFISRDIEEARADPAQIKAMDQIVPGFSQMPKGAQEQTMFSLAPSLPNIDPAPKGYKSALKTADGWKVPLGSFDQALELQDAIKAKNPAERALRVGPLILDGTITSTNDIAQKIQENAPKASPLDALKYLSSEEVSSENHSPPDPIITPMTDSENMLDKMNKAMQYH